MFPKTSLFSTVIFKPLYFMNWWHTSAMNQEAIKILLILLETELKVVHISTLPDQKHPMTKIQKMYNFPSLSPPTPFTALYVMTLNSAHNWRQSMPVDFKCEKQNPETEDLRVFYFLIQEQEFYNSKLLPIPFVSK